MLLCRAVVTTTDLPALVSVLDAVYVRVTDDDPPRWHEYVTTHGLERVRATIVVEEEGVVVETNSAERLDRVLDAIRIAHPAIVVVSDARTSLDDARAALPATSPAATGSGAGMLDQNDPQVAAMLADLMQRYEQAWLDDSIPALAGMTPRQAADDPTRRPQLIRLLASFPDDDAPGTMSPRRLRAALGL